MLEHVRSKLESKEMHHKDPNYPIVSLERYSSPSTVCGVGSGEGAKMEIRYGVTLRAEFVRANFGEMNKLWVRMQHQGAVRDREGGANGPGKGSRSELSCLVKFVSAAVFFCGSPPRRPRASPPGTRRRSSAAA